MARRARRIAIHAAMALVACLFALPLLFMLANSLMSALEVSTRYTPDITAYNLFSPHTKTMHYAEFSLVPRFVSLDQYRVAFLNDPSYLRFFWNSVALSVPIVVGQCAIAVPCAYAFERLRWRGKEGVFFLIMIVMMLPLQVSLVSNYIIAELLHIKDSYWAIILPGIFNPFGIFLARQQLKALPMELEEAAQIDGASRLSIFLHIALPLVKTSVASLALLTFIEAWNIVDQAVVFIADRFGEPLSVYLSRMVTQDVGRVCAVSCFYMIPIVFLFLLGREQMVEGIQLSGIK